MRKYVDLEIENSVTVEDVLNFGKSFNPFILLNSNSDKQLQEDPYSKFNMLLAAGSLGEVEKSGDVFHSLKEFHQKEKDWVFGYISYDIKNQLENLSSENHNGIGAPDFRLFKPRFVIEISGKRLRTGYDPAVDTEKTTGEAIAALIKTNPPSVKKQALQIHSRIPKVDYIEQVMAIQKHIQRGDIYEINFCMEFYSENAIINPEFVYNKLNMLSPMPFSVYLRCNNIHLMCASPERFIAKRGSKIISQPIKGTIRRGIDAGEDEKMKNILRNSPKEQSENVMIVDLVRNDLSHTAKKGSVRVEELFGIKSFRQLHQMVSTVVSEIEVGIHFTDAIKKAFPMGSMTGAPKIRAMELIERFEKTKRGLYSGTAGYITPEGDFDFNVIIRSIIYNSDNHYLSFMAGSAITSGSDPENEYGECLLKAEAMKGVLT